MMDEGLNDFIDEYMKDDGSNIEPTIEDQKGPVEEDIVIVSKESNDVEATPFVPESSDMFELGDDCISTSSNSIPYTSQIDYIKKSIESHLTESNAVIALKYEIDNNRILIHDLKSSVVSLKVSTSRIEDDVKDLTMSVKKYSKDKNVLDTSIIDLEFRLNELLSKEDENDTNDNDNNNNSNTDDVSMKIENNEQYEQVQAQIKQVVEQIEGKIKLIDQKISCIDDQNLEISTLAKDIKRNEDIVKDIHSTLSTQQRDLKKIDILQQLIENDKEKQVDEVSVIRQQHTPNKTQKKLEEKIQEFIMKTECNEKSIETAWVGLIAALLLIPIAFFMGKFM